MKQVKINTFLKKIDYDDLNARQKEIYNFQKVASLLADYGFNCIKLADDWHGADFLAYHKDGESTLKVQLKSRPTIAKKYLGKEIYVAFPISKTWYLIEHDKLVHKVGEDTNWLRTESWKNKGMYSADIPNPELLKNLIEYKLE